MMLRLILIMERLCSVDGLFSLIFQVKLDKPAKNLLRAILAKMGIMRERKTFYGSIKFGEK